MTDLVAQLVGALERVDAEWSSFWPLGPDAPSSSDRVCAIAPETAEIWRAIRAALSAAKDGGWVPIETAPKDTMVLVASEFFGPGDWRIKVGYFFTDENKWVVFGASWTPTKWQPLPNPPKGEV